MQAFLVLLTLPKREFPMDLRYSYAVYHITERSVHISALEDVNRKVSIWIKNKKFILTLLSSSELWQETDPF